MASRAARPQRQRRAISPLAAIAALGLAACGPGTSALAIFGVGAAARVAPVAIELAEEEQALTRFGQAADALDAASFVVDEYAVRSGSYDGVTDDVLADLNASLAPDMVLSIESATTLSYCLSATFPEADESYFYGTEPGELTVSQTSCA